MAEDFSKRRILKYELKAMDRQIVMMPKGAVALKFGRQGPMLFIWMSVDRTQPAEPRVFRVVTTGEVFNEEHCVFVGHAAAGETFLYEIETAVQAQNPDLVDEDKIPEVA